jgi:hypothetical protein
VTGADARTVSSLATSAAPSAVTVLPAKASRRVTRRDGLLPLVWTLELLVGVAFGLAAHSGGPVAAGAAARVPLAPVSEVAALSSSAPVTTLIPVTPVRTHAPRNPFGALVQAAR